MTAAKNPFILALILALGAGPAAAQISTLSKLGKRVRKERLTVDAAAVLVYRKGLESVVAFTDSKPELFPKTKTKEARLLTREQRSEIWGAWKRLAS